MTLEEIKQKYKYGSLMTYHPDKKLIKQLLDTAIKEKDIEPFKYSISYKRRWIKITLYRLPFELYTPLAKKCISEGDVYFNTIDRKVIGIYPIKSNIYTQEYCDLGDKIKAIINVFNYDNSDIQTDYFDFNFIVDIQPSEKLLEEVNNEKKR